MKNTAESPKKAKNKKGGKFIKILILAVVLAILALGGIIVSDIFFSGKEDAPQPETVTITVSGKAIYLNGDRQVTLQELEDYFTDRTERMDYCTIALINDTKNPADIDTYNAVVEILGKFGIEQQPLTLPATEDEFKPASVDEYGFATPDQSE